jgi:predicted RND superfamily exporter protein
MMETEKEFVESAKHGVAISLLFSFLILLLATQNIILAFLSILCVGIVIMSVVAIIVLQQWEFGSSESVCIVIAIGLSVDYCVHLATAFSNSAYKHRKYKMK